MKRNQYVRHMARKVRLYPDYSQVEVKYNPYVGYMVISDTINFRINYPVNSS